MTITVGVDVYATIAEADAYSTGRGWTAWGTASDAEKEFALKDAAVYLDSSYTWKGSIATLSQALAWPRAEVTDKEGRTLDNSTIPQRIKDASAELANLRLAGPLVTAADNAKLSELQTGSVKMKFVDGQEVNEAERLRTVDRLLVGLYETRAGQKSLSAPLIRV